MRKRIASLLELASLVFMLGLAFFSLFVARWIEDLAVEVFRTLRAISGSYAFLVFYAAASIFAYTVMHSVMRVFETCPPQDWFGPQRQNRIAHPM